MQEAVQGWLFHSSAAKTSKFDVSCRLVTATLSRGKVLEANTYSRVHWLWAPIWLVINLLNRNEGMECTITSFCDINHDKLTDVSTLCWSLPYFVLGHLSIFSRAGWGNLLVSFSDFLALCLGRQEWFLGSTLLGHTDFRPGSFVMCVMCSWVEATIQAIETCCSAILWIFPAG